MSDRTAHSGFEISQNIMFSGRVQGVGFRLTAQRFAVDLGLTGWVQNWPNGDVEIYAEGKPGQISALVNKLQAHFFISNMQICEGSASGEYTSFDIRY